MKKFVSLVLICMLTLVMAVPAMAVASNSKTLRCENCNKPYTRSCNREYTVGSAHDCVNSNASCKYNNRRGYDQFLCVCGHTNYNNHSHGTFHTVKNCPYSTYGCVLKK